MMFPLLEKLYYADILESHVWLMLFSVSFEIRTRKEMYDVIQHRQKLRGCSLDEKEIEVLKKEFFEGEALAVLTRRMGEITEELKDILMPLLNLERWDSQEAQDIFRGKLRYTRDFTCILEEFESYLSSYSEEDRESKRSLFFYFRVLSLSYETEEVEFI